MKQKTTKVYHLLVHYLVSLIIIDKNFHKEQTLLHLRVPTLGYKSTGN